MFKYLISFALILFSTVAFSQLEKYISPPDYINGDIRISVADAIGQDETYKFKLIITNSSDTDYYVYDINKTGYELEGLGIYYPKAKRKPIIVPPGKEKFVVISLAVGVKPPVKAYTLHLEGLSVAKPEQMQDFPMINLSVDKLGKTESDNIIVNLVKVQKKKDVFSIQGELKLKKGDGSKYILVYSPEETEASEGENSLMVESGAKKSTVLRESEDKKVKLSITSTAESVSLNLTKALRKLKLESVDIPNVNLSNGQKINVVNTCSPITSDVEGSIKINVSSEVGCFKFYLMGLEINSENTSNLTFHMNPSSKKVKIVMDGGQIIEKSIWAKDDYKALYYTIKEKNGEFNLRYMPGSSELADKVIKGGSDHQEVSKTESFNTCPSIESTNTSGSTTVNLMSEIGCFKLYLQGQLLTPEFTSHLSFKMNSSIKKLKVVMENGAIAEKKLMLGEGYDKVFYHMKEKNGEYMVKANHMAAEASSGTNHEIKGGDILNTYYNEDISVVFSVTVVKISKSTVYYYKGKTGTELLSISKRDCLGVEYSDGSCDRMDFNRETKRGGEITRTEEETALKHRESTKGKYDEGGYFIGRSKRY